MRKLLLLLICFVAPLQLGADGETRPWKIAYDFCLAVPGDNGYQTECEVRLSTDGSDAVRLMPGAQPVWSGNGLRAAIGNGDIYVFNLADSTVMNLTNTDPMSAQYAPRWAPDGARIAFATYRDGASAELHVANADGSARIRLTQNLSIDGAFAWSPDGTAIAFAGTADGSPELFVVGADGSNPTRLTNDIGFNAVSQRRPETAAPSWSPDGTRVAFDCAHDVCTVNRDGTDLTKVTTDGAFSFGAQFSPVDGRIAFATSRFGAIEVAIIAPDGTVVRLAPGLRAWQPAWSPAGQRLAVSHFPEENYAAPADGSHVSNGEIYTINADGTDLRPFASGQHAQWAPSLPGQPAATFTSACSGSACQFDATGSFDPDGHATSYLWKFGDGTTSSYMAPLHSYATGASYNVTLIVTDGGGAIDVALKSIRANEPPVASFMVSCSGSTCTFDGSASTDGDGTIAQYSWLFGDGGSAQGAGAIVSYKYGTGTFAATLTVQDSGGADGSSEQTVTVVNAPPVAAFTAACSDLTCTFDASGSSDEDGTIREYQWQFGSGATAYGQVVTYAYGSGGTYEATLTVRDDVWQSASATRTVTVTAPVAYMHVGDLDGSARTGPKTWDAFVTVYMHAQHHNGINDVVISGSWSDGTAASCTTSGSGACTVAKYSVPRKTVSLTFTVSAATHPALVYDPARNHDQNGDSSGTAITVSRQ